MTKKDLDDLRSLLLVVRAHVSGEVEDASPERATELLDAALAMLDPDRQRPLTPLGKRIVDAATVVALDVCRLEEALRGRAPTGTLTRLLHHDVRKVRSDVLTLLADLIGCELAWLQTGAGKPRTKPIPPGVIAARGFGASEEAIRIVREKYADPDWDEASWVVAFLAMTKQIRESGGPPGSDTWKVPGTTPK